jgi:hypothetical protein
MDLEESDNAGGRQTTGVRMKQSLYYMLFGQGKRPVE